MSVRRLADHQPPSFAFSPDNLAWAKREMAKYPEGRQASAVISLLWRAQDQEGWVTEPAIRAVADLLGMPYIRVLEVATFYTMFHLEPVGRVADDDEPKAAELRVFAVGGPVRIDGVVLEQLHRVGE